MSVCILVVSDNGLIDGCLDSLAGSKSSVDTEFIVVANGLDEGRLSSFQDRDDIVLVHSSVNTGFSGGNNLAARFARGRYLLLLNDDSVVEDGFVDQLVRAVERDPSVAAAGGRILSIDGTLQEAGSVLWRDGWVAHVGTGLANPSTAYNYVRYADYVSANGLLVERQAWDAIGGLDERYFPAYYEDVDFCLALREHGYRVVYEPRARLTHLESQSTSSTYRGFLLIRNRGQLVAKWSQSLAEFGEHPDPIDEVAIDAAVLRAERSVGRVMLIEDTADATEWRGLHAVELLRDAHWSVMLSVPVGRGREGADRAIRDQMIDLGVDVREERPENLVAEHGPNIEAVVSVGPGTGRERSFWRPDGSMIPFVRGANERDSSLVSRVAAAARRTGSPSSAPATEKATKIQDLTVTVPRRRDDRSYVEADISVRREYVDYLEFELARTREALDETDVHLRRTLETLEHVGASLEARERYIDSLPSVRVKKWIATRYARRTT